MMSSPFRIGLSSDFFNADDTRKMPFVDLSGLEQPGIELVHLPPALTVAREDLEGLNAFMSYFCTVEDAALEGNDTIVAICKMGAGYDNMAVPKMTEMGIGYTNTREAYCGAVATAALTLLLAVETRLQERGKIMREGADGWWRGHGLFHKGLPGRTLGLLGPGFIGRAFLRLIQPFGMKSIVTGGSVRPEIAAEYGFDYVDVDTLFRDADIVVMACPLTDATRGLASRQRLFSMKPGSLIVNVGRGLVVDEAALIEALQTGHLGGAGLDVTTDEPTGIDNPLLHMDNVVVTPHSLANDEHGHKLSADQTIGALLAVCKGEAPTNLVNPEIVQMPRWRKHLDSVEKTNRRTQQEP